MNFIARIGTMIGHVSQYLLVRKIGTEIEITRSHGRYQRIALSSTSGLFARVVGAMSNVASLPLVLSHLSKEQFGVWMIASSLVVWAQLADLGISNGLTNAISEANARSDRQAATAYLSTALVATVLIAGLSLPMLFVISLWMPWGSILNVGDILLIEIASDALLITGLAVIINMPVSLINRVFMATQRGHAVNLSQAAASIMTLIALAIAVKFGLNVLWLIGITAIMPVLANALLWLKLPSTGVNLKFGELGISRRALSRVADSSIPLFLFQCGALLVNQLVYVILVQVSDLSTVTDFNIIMRFYIFAFSIGGALSAPFYPAVREAFELKERDWVTRAVVQCVTIRLFATLPFIILFVTAGDAMLAAWLKAETAPRLALFGWLSVSAALMFATTSSALSEMLSGLDVIWSQLKLVFSSAAITLGLLTGLVPAIGVAGVFVAMTASTIYPIYWLVR